MNPEPESQKLRKRIKILAKGNFDIQQSLVVGKSGDRVEWNGINEAFALKNLPVKAQVKHELMLRSDTLVNQSKEIPKELIELALPLTPFTLEAQFKTSVFSEPADVVVLTVQPDIVNTPYRHREKGYFFLPYRGSEWSSEQRKWFYANFEPCPPISPDDSMRNFCRITNKLREFSNPVILIYNLSTFVPGERIISYAGITNAISERIKRFNLSLIDLSKELDICIIDVDRIVAEHGAARLKTSFSHVSADGWRLIAEEVADVLDQSGLFDKLSED